MRWCSRCGGPNNRRPTCDAGLHGLFQHDWSYCLLLLFCGTELRPGPPFENLDEMSEIEIGVSLRKAEGDELTGLLADRHRHAKPFSLREAERSEEHTSELQSLMRISYAVFCLKKKNNN